MLAFFDLKKKQFFGIEAFVLRDEDRAFPFDFGRFKSTK